MVPGPAAGLDLLDSLAADERITAGHQWHAVRAHLLERTGDRSGARASYRAAAARTTNLAQQRYLHAKAADLAD